MWYENTFQHKLLLTNTQVSKLLKIKSSKTRLHKIGQSERFLPILLGPLLKPGLLFMENVLNPLATSVLIPLGLTAAGSAADETIHKKMFGSGNDYTDNLK